ncbi:MAG TPA: EAL domain-containing protein [Acidimicrobiales bacterium]|nr:EAL domain-containing protein [Acidimicrobiales bacterium]
MLDVMESMRLRVSGLLHELPRGKTLPDELWVRRQNGILLLLAAHVPGLFLYALYRGVGVVHAALEAALVAVFAWGATVLRRERRWSTVAAALGLLTSSAVLVHLSDGLIEMHFHFFVVIGIVTLYQDWEPFLIAIVYVVVEHGVGGAVLPGAVYNHAGGVENPWAYAALHGAFILAMSGAGVASWRLNERLISQVSTRQDALTEAQHIARLGSWEWDIRTDEVTWSDQLHVITGVPRHVPASLSLFLEGVHPDDLPVVESEVREMLGDGSDREFQLRWRMPDGEVRWMHARSHTRERDATGAVVRVSGTMQDSTERMVTDASLRQTLSLLNATLDSTADGILVVDLDGVVTTMSRRFVDMWRLEPANAVPGVPVRDLTASVLDQLRDPDEFLDRARALNRSLEAESHDVIEFVDGRVFERYSTPQRVGGEVVGRVWTCRDVTEHKQLQDDLAHQAFHDPLTGLANQALFRALVEHAIARFGRTQVPVAVLFIDLDDFKTVNDSLGHTVGDELLVAVSERLGHCVRPADTTARLGGDEFAVLIEEASSAEEASAIAERILEALRRPLQVSGKELYASASIGIAFGHAGLHGDQLLRNADLAMYTAKRKGRRRFEVYEPDMHAAAIARLELEADLRGAVARGELVVHYQPIVDLTSGTTRGVEALVRWLHPTRGLILPDVFIAVAEETDLINEIGGFVLEVACAQVREWQHSPGREELIVTVNLSPRQLLDETITERVASVLARSGLSPSALVLEITEGAMVHDADLAVSRLDALKALGVHLAIDDFGTGYSSLSYLHRLPIDIVKIDRSFVEQLDRDDASLASAIVSMAQALQLTTIAEGVETPHQLSVLRDLGCELAQGFHLAMPADADTVSALLGIPVRTRLVATLPD